MNKRSNINMPDSNSNQSNCGTKKIKYIVTFVLILFVLVLSIYILSATIFDYIKTKNTISKNTNISSEPYTPKDDNSTMVPIDKNSSIRIIKSYNKEMFSGSKSILFFWASWCSHCSEEIDVIKNVIANYQNRGYKIYVISHDYDINTLTEYMKNNDFNYEVYFDEGRIIRKNLVPEANSVPLTYFLDEKVDLIYAHDGAITIDTLDSLIATYIQ